LQKNQLWDLLERVYKAGLEFEEVLSPNAPDLVTALQNLYQHGIQLGPSEGEAITLNENFNITVLAELKSLYNELRHEEVQSDDNISILLIGFKIFRILLSKFVFGEEIMMQTHIWDLKMKVIPAFLEKDGDILRQYLTEMSVLEKKIMKTKTRLFTDVSRPNMLSSLICNLICKIGKFPDEFLQMEGMQNGLVEKRKEVGTKWDSVYHMAVQINSWPVFPDEEAFLTEKYGAEQAKAILDLRRFTPYLNLKSLFEELTVKSL